MNDDTENKIFGEILSMIHDYPLSDIQEKNMDQVLRTEQKNRICNKKHYWKNKK